MKTQISLSTIFLAAALPLAAQSTAPTPAVVHHTAATSAAGCTKLPPMSPKIPALPASATCPKTLLKFTNTPAVKLDYVSPLVTPEIRESLGLSSSTFSLDYVEIKPGTGALAAPKKWYTLQYTGYLLDGTKFDSSLDRKDPFSFPVGAHRVIAGWDLGFQGMHVGGKRRLIIPYQLGYGDKGSQAIPPRATLVFDIELIAQSDDDPTPKPAPPAAPKPAAPAPTPGIVPPTAGTAPASNGATPTPATAPPATPPPAAKPTTPPTK